MTRTQFLAELHTYNIGPQWKYSSIFPGTPPISVGVHCKIVFVIVLRHQLWGVPFSELEKIFFFNIIKGNWSFRGTCFLLKRSSWGISDIQGCCSPKGNYVYKLYTLLHERDPITSSTDDIFIIQNILVGWKFETCPFMSIYAAVWVIFW